jgi:colicin import membrane protein
MKPFAVPFLLLLAIPLAGHALDEKAERARIAGERRQADMRFAEEEKACRAKFAVTDCVADAKARQRQVLATLRREEITLNEMERKRKAAEKLRDMEERQSPERLAADAKERAEALQERGKREAALAERAAKRQVDTAKPASSAPRVVKRVTPDVSPSKAEANRREHARRMAEAEAHRAKAAQRIAQKKKPAASGLPVPP